MLNFEFDLLGFVSHFHAGPPQLSVRQLEDHGIFADVEVDHLLFFIALTDDFCWVVDSLVNLNADLRFDSHLS